MAKNDKAPEVEKTEKEIENDKRREAYSVATTNLRAKYREDFDEMLKSEYAERGLTFRKRLSDKEKAIKKMREAAESIGLTLTDEQIADMLAQQEVQNDPTSPDDEG